MKSCRVELEGTCLFQGVIMGAMECKWNHMLWNHMVAQGAGEDNQGWDIPMEWRPGARVELRFLCDMLPHMHGRAYTPNTAWVTMQTIGDSSGAGSGARVYQRQGRRRYIVAALTHHPCRPGPGPWPPYQCTMGMGMAEVGPVGWVDEARNSTQALAMQCVVSTSMGAGRP